MFLVAVLLLIPLLTAVKKIICVLITYYVSAITIFKLIYDAYEGFIDYPDFCNTPHLVEWLYWVGLISDDTKPALVCPASIISIFAHCFLHNL